MSISSDYNLADPEEFAAAREVLRTLSENVVAEEATGFNPSGIGVDDPGDIDATSIGAAKVGESDVKSNSDLTVATESSQPLSLASAISSASKSSAHDAPELFRVDVFDDLSDRDKEGQLCQMFTSLKPIDISLALKKRNGDASLAIDELLNLQLLEESGQRLKGIDGFCVPDGEPVGKKKKGKKKKKAHKGSLVQSPTSPVAPEQVFSVDEEHDGKRFRDSLGCHANIPWGFFDTKPIYVENIAFVSERFHWPKPQVTEMYYTHNASIGATVVAIIDKYIALGVEFSDVDQFQDAKEQAEKHLWVPQEYVFGAFDMCQSRQYAIDIAELLGDHFERPAYLKYNVSYSSVASTPKPVIDSKENSATSTSQLVSKPTSPRSPTDTVRTEAVTRAASFYGTNTTSAEVAVARDHSFTSAAAAFRKGRGNPLFRQAGAYYAERAREQASIQRQFASEEAERLVDRNSTRSMVDLHGVTVADGVDIARNRVLQWWDGLGEDRTRKAREEGLTIVTGVGRHSVDGRSRLRSSVFKALVADGWKIEVLTGACCVTGRRRA